MAATSAAGTTMKVGSRRMVFSRDNKERRPIS